MSVARSSYLKTISLTVAATVGGVVFAVLAQLLISGPLGLWISVAGWVGVAIVFTVLMSGLLVLYRDSRAIAGLPDLFLTLNRSRSEPALATLPADASRPRGFMWPRFLSPNSVRVGDWVEIRSWEEIRRTLDEKGTLEGVPFMPEMLAFCGKRARVLRSVDKVYDYGRSKTLRRVDNTVLLTNVRCNGSAHDGCQARCSIFWKTAWLKRAGDSVAPGNAEAREPAAAKVENLYVCQYTQVVASSHPLSSYSISQYIKPLFSGNVTVSAFVMALITRLFNRAQGLRGGIPFPHVTNSGQAKTPTESKGLAVGETVHVLSAKEIYATLDVTFRNRGMWFDREMVKFCRQPSQVILRVERIIDDATGKMVPMKTPCILLDDVVASGEYLRFLGQQEYIFWRENWLGRESPKDEP